MVEWALEKAVFLLLGLSHLPLASFVSLSVEPVAATASATARHGHTR